MHRSLVASMFSGLIIGVLAPPAAAQSPEQIEKIKAAAPAESYAKPAKPRKLLVFSLTRGYRHGSIPVGAAAMKILGEKSGAFEIVHSEDIAVFEPASLEQFDAICMLNTTGELFTPPNLAKMPESERNEAMAREKRLKKSLLDFVTAGGGLVGIHAATDCFYKWPEYGRMIGGYFNGHPWHEKVSVNVEKREHPLCQMFDADRFEIVDEIYQLRDPYSRKRLNVLLSIDTERTNMEKGGIKRKDNDFAVSWARRRGKGRVFYCSLGHRDEIYWNPLILRHYLAGIQFALGDLDWLQSEQRADRKPGQR